MNGTCRFFSTPELMTNTPNDDDMKGERTSRLSVTIASSQDIEK